MRQAKPSDQGMCACMAIHQFTARKIATVQNSRIDPAETDHWGETASRIVLEPQFDESALLGLGAFSHVEVLFVFDRAVERDRYEPRPSRGRADLPAVGVFADRGPRRPNRIGASFCRLVEVRGDQLVVAGLDAVDGTPVLDIKPAMAAFLPRDVREPDWVGRLLREYY